MLSPQPCDGLEITTNNPPVLTNRQNGLHWREAGERAGIREQFCSDLGKGQEDPNLFPFPVLIFMVLLKDFPHPEIVGES